MRKKKAVENRKEENIMPDCCTCIRRKACERAEEGTFCTRFQSREPEPDGPDPNGQWKRGEEAEF